MVRKVYTNDDNIYTVGKKALKTFWITIAVLLIITLGINFVSYKDVTAPDLTIPEEPVVAYSIDIHSLIQGIITDEVDKGYGEFNGVTFDVTGEVYQNSIEEWNFITLGCSCDTCIFNYVLFDIHPDYDNEVRGDLMDCLEGQTVTLRVIGSDYNNDGAIDFQIIDVVK